MEKEHRKLLIPAMGSRSDGRAFARPMRGKSIEDYFQGKGILIYNHPDSRYLTTSIHRTTKHTLNYSHDINEFVRMGNQTVVVAYGSLAFALPGVMAAEAYCTPILAVPADIDAFFNVYKMHDGIPVGVVEPGNLEKGFKLAEKILSLEKESPIELIVNGNCERESNVKTGLDLVPQYRKVKDDGKQREGVTVCLSDNIDYLTDLDKRVEFGVFGVAKEIPSSALIESQGVRNIMQQLSNSVLIGRPKNLALFAARLYACFDYKLALQLQALRKKEANAYPKRSPIRLEHFGGK